MNKHKYAVNQILRLPTAQKIIIRQILTESGIKAEFSDKNLSEIFSEMYLSDSQLNYKSKDVFLNIYAKDCVKEAMDISNEAHLAYLEDKAAIDKVESDIKKLCQAKGWIYENNTFWVKRVYRGAVVKVEKILKGLHAETLQYVYITANFDANTGKQLNEETINHVDTLEQLKDFVIN